MSSLALPAFMTTPIAARVDRAGNDPLPLTWTFRNSIEGFPTMRQILLPCAAVLFACASTGATAGEVTIVVSTEGLDLAQSADIATMKDRIDVAVKRACTRRTTAAHFTSEAVEECIADGTTKALDALDARIAAEN
jgi:UrcA family protein